MSATSSQTDDRPRGEQGEDFEFEPFRMTMYQCTRCRRAYPSKTNAHRHARISCDDAPVTSAKVWVAKATDVGPTMSRKPERRDPVRRFGNAAPFPDDVDEIRALVIRSEKLRDGLGDVDTFAARLFAATYGGRGHPELRNALRSARGVKVLTEDGVSTIPNVSYVKQAVWHLVETVHRLARDVYDDRSSYPAEMFPWAADVIGMLEDKRHRSPRLRLSYLDILKGWSEMTPTFYRLPREAKDRYTKHLKDLWETLEAM